MDKVYPEVDKLNEKPKVGKGDCAELVQRYAQLPNHTAWRAGAQVFGNTRLLKGTAIATFVNGRYPNHDKGNHAAFFLSQGTGGFWVMDQFKTKDTISKRFIRARGKKNDGSYWFPSDNALAFSVIEVK